MRILFEIGIYPTHITVSNAKEASVKLSRLLELFEYEDEYEEVMNILGYVINEEKDILYFNKGVDVEYIRKCLVDVSIKTYSAFEPDEMIFDYEEIIPPRNEEQVEMINFVSAANEWSTTSDSPQIFMVAKTGVGKALPYSAKIPTPSGYSLMGDLKVGDYVFDRLGRPTKVLKIYEQGEKDVYKVTFKDGRTARCTLDHLWTVRKSISYTNGKKVWVNKTLKELLVDYKVEKSEQSKSNDPNRDEYRYKYYIPTNGPVEYEHRDVMIHPWVLGCFIGNGCCLQIPLTISCGTDEIPKRIAEIYNFDIVYPKRNYSYMFRDKKTGHFIKTKEFFKHYPEILNYSYNKTIPEDYIYNDIDTRIQLLRGLMDTDGTVSVDGVRTRLSYSSTSMELLEQMQQITYSLGWSSTISRDKRKDKYTNGFCGRLNFRIPNADKHLLFSVSYKYNATMLNVNTTQKDIYDDLLIKDISLVYKEKARCILVDNPEHLFLTENFIVTHNTFTSCVGAVLYKKKTLIVCHRKDLLKQWQATLIEKIGMDDSDIHTLTTEDFLAAEQMKLDLGDVYLLSHQTFRFALHAMNNDFERVSKAIENFGIGLKIIDEAHLEFRNIVDIDMCMNIKRNLYLTATDGRSSKDENAIFKHVFTNAVKFTKNAKHKNKWIEYCTIFINTNVPYKVSKFQLENGRGMSATKYGKAVIKRDRNKTHFNAINELLRVIFTRDEHAKVLIFMPLIELCDELEFFINTHLNKDQSFDYDLRVGTINSHNTKLENDRSAKCDVIISTILSCGTGKDIPGLTDIICCSPFKSAITTQQVIGRLRYYGKNCGYWDIVDESVKMDMIFAKIRSKTIKTIALSMSSMQFSIF